MSEEQRVQVESRDGEMQIFGVSSPRGALAQMLAEGELRWARGDREAFAQGLAHVNSAAVVPFPAGLVAKPTWVPGPPSSSRCCAPRPTFGSLRRWSGARGLRRR